MSVGTQAREHRPAWTPDESALRQLHRSGLDVLIGRYREDWDKGKKNVPFTYSKPVVLEDAITLYGQLACYYDQAPEAVEAFEIVLDRIDETNAAALNYGIQPHHFLSKVLMGQGRYEDALTQLRRITRFGIKTGFRPFFALVHTLWRLGRYHDPECVDARRQICDFMRLTAREGGLERYFTPALCSFEPYERRDYWKARVESALEHTTGSGNPGGAWAAPSDAWHGQGYVAVPNILPKNVRSFFKRWLDMLRISQSTQTDMKRWIPHMKRWEYKEDPFSVHWNMMLVPLVAELTGTDVFPTYPFPITYEEGGALPPHKDVLDNDISLTTQIHAFPDGASHPLLFQRHLAPRTREEEWSLGGLDLSESERLGRAEYTLDNNDAVLYQGTLLYHWRTPIPAGHHHHQIVFGFRTVNASSCNAQ